MPSSWIASDRLMVEKLEEETYKGDLLKFKTGSWEPKSWYLVRNRPPVDYAPDLKYEGRGQLSILGKRGGEYVIAWDTYPFEVWLVYVEYESDGFKYPTSRAAVSQVKVMDAAEAEEQNPDYLHDYFSDARMVEAWPHV